MKVLLKDVANVRISNVDKKSYDGETPITLCNFTDVYYNWRITEENCKDFMRATAVSSEIEKFQVHAGDVAITKDSETRYDIGISAYFDSITPDLLLGYHCALIRPNSQYLLGAYLNALLNTTYAQKYFACNATGSGQRYSLSLDCIQDFPIELPTIETQLRITNILGSIDKKIEINKKKIAKLEAIAVDYLDYWYSNHSTYNAKLESLAVSARNAIVDGPFGTQMKIEDYVSFGIPIIEMEYLNGYTISAPIKHFITEEKYNTVSRSTASSGDVILSKTGTLGLLGVIPKHIKRSVIVSRLAKITPDTNKISPYTLLILLKRLGKKRYWEKQSSGSTMPILNIEIIKNAPILICSEMKELNSYIDEIYKRINLIIFENKNLETQKSELLPLLMNGQAVVR